MSDFRITFEMMSDEALVSPIEFACLLNTTRACLYNDLALRRVVEPVIRRNRQIRWRAGDIRAWLRGLQPAPVRLLTVPPGGHKRMGRKRKLMTTGTGSP